MPKIAYGLLPSQAARELEISSRTLTRWSNSGKIKFTRSAGNWRFYDQADVQRLKCEMEKARGERKKV